MNIINKFNKIVLAVLFVIIVGGFIFVPKSHAAYVQSASGYSAGPIVLNGVTAGNTLVAWVSGNGSLASTTLPAGWTKLTPMGTATVFGCWWIYNNHPGGNVSDAITTAPVDPGWSIHEYSGRATSALGQNVTNLGTGTIATANVTTTVAGEDIVAAAAQESAAYTPTWNNSFTGRTVQNGHVHSTADLVNQNISTYTASSTINAASVNWVMGAISLMPNSPTVTTGAESVSAGQWYGCARLSDGRVQCWGSNTEGQLGNGNTTQQLTPVAASGITTATAIATGYGTTCALLSDSTVKCWGYNLYGQTGNGNTTTPQLTPAAVSGISTATAITAGYYHTCALLSNSTVKCWGNNTEGQLGDGTSYNSSTPVVVSGISTATDITAGDYHTCARLSDSTVKCWGKNDEGQTGNGNTTTPQLTPVVVTGISTATNITAGDKYACARLSDSTVKCWGWNIYGQLGNGSNYNSSTPVVVTGITTATAITASEGGNDACAVLSNGTVKCWGANGTAQLGNGTVGIGTSSNIPVLVSNIPAPSAPPVTTSAASGLSTNSAVLNSTINPNGASTNVYYLWGTTNQSCALYTNTLNGPTGLTGTANLSGATTQATLSGLSGNSTYYFCVMATNTYGTTYGTTTSFTTNSTPGAYVMMDAGSALGSGATDCQDDPNGGPCAPTTVNASNSSSQTQNSVTWSGTDTGGAVPAGTGFDLKWCTGAACTPNSSAILNVSSGYTHSFSANPSTIYRYAIAGKNANGTGTYSTAIGQTTTASSCTNTTVYSDNDGDGYGNSSSISQGLVMTGHANNNATVIINKPGDIVNGMFMVLSLGWTGGTGRSLSTINGVAAPAGWTLINSTDNGTGYSSAVYYKLASGEPASYSIVLSGTANDTAGFITSFGNVDTVSPINVASGTTASSTTVYDSPSINTTVTNTMVVAVYGSQIGAGYFSTPSGMTPITNTTSTSLYDVIAAYRMAKGSTGLTGVKTSNINTPATAGTIIMFALKNGQSTTTQCVSGGVATGNWSVNQNDCDDLTSSYYQLNNGYADFDGDGQVSSSVYSLCSGGSLRTGANASSGSDCNDADGTKYQNVTCYPDQDNDTYSADSLSSQCSSPGVCPLGYLTTLSNPADCYDGNAEANPAQGGFAGVHRGDGSFDYDCSGNVSFNSGAYYILGCPDYQSYCAALSSSDCGVSRWVNSGCSCYNGAQNTVLCK